MKDRNGVKLKYGDYVWYSGPDPYKLGERVYRITKNKGYDEFETAVYVTNPKNSGCFMSQWCIEKLPDDLKEREQVLYLKKLEL